MILLVSQSAETHSPRPIDRNSSITNPLITHMKKRLLGFVMVFLVIASSAAAQRIRKSDVVG
jgi:hypothetical protein